MPPKTTNAQYKNKLAYNSGTQPAFIRALQARISGKPDPTLRDKYGDDDDGGEDADWEQLDSNRPAIPRRPDAPSQSAGAGNSKHDEDEEFDDERPTVVVLKEGKHLTALEVTNEKRRLKGLPPLPPPETNSSKSEDSSKPTTSSNPKDASNISSSSQANVSLSARAAPKRKLETSDSSKAKDGEKAKSSSGKAKGDSKEKAPAKKKAKKESKNLLSFGDE